MKEINLDNYLIDRERELVLGGKKIIVKPLSINRTLMATKIYQDAEEMMNKAIRVRDEKLKKEKQKKKNKEETDEVKETYSDKKESAADNYNVSKKYVSKIIDVIIFIIKPIGFKENIKSFFSGNIITRKWLMNNCTMDQLQGFINDIIMPVIGEKKNQTGSL